MRKMSLVSILLGIAAIAGLFFVLPRLNPPFPESTIREYESLLTFGERSKVPQGALPYRTGKVVTLRPSTWQVYRLGTLLLTQIPPALEGKKEKEIDPPRLELISIGAPSARDRAKRRQARSAADGDTAETEA